MWDVIEELVSGGTTLLLTTQYLDEADRLADRIAVVDGDRVIAEGTADELKARVGGERLEIAVAEGGNVQAAARVLECYARDGGGNVRSEDDDRRRMSVTVEGGARILAPVVRDLDRSGVQIDDLGLRRPTIDDVFLALTGRAADPSSMEEPAGTGQRDDRDEKEKA